MKKDYTTYEQLEGRSSVKQNINVDRCEKLSEWINAMDDSMTMLPTVKTSFHQLVDDRRLFHKPARHVCTFSGEQDKIQCGLNGGISPES